LHSTMSHQPFNRTAAMSEKKECMQPVDDTTATSSPETQDNINKDAPESINQQARAPAFPLIKPYENLQAQYGQMHDKMIDFVDKGNHEEAEKLAHKLLSFGNLPVLYRAYAHMILAHGLEDCLFHAQKAVEEAEWGLNKYGDDKGAGSKLLAITKRVLAKTEEAEASGAEEEEDDGEAELELKEESKDE
ncbi:unnamed protein product, partial [Aureobasidium mustum]